MRTFTFLLRAPTLRLRYTCDRCRATDLEDRTTKAVFSHVDVMNILDAVERLSKMPCGCAS